MLFSRAQQTDQVEAIVGTVHVDELAVSIEQRLRAAQHRALRSSHVSIAKFALEQRRRVVLTLVEIVQIGRRVFGGRSSPFD